MILLIDNHDSFTHILAAYLSKAGNQEVVITQEIPSDQLWRESSAIILSPGPGLPSEHPVMMSSIDRALHEDKPLLGVCLGMQALWVHGGGQLRHIGKVVHGIASDLQISDDPLWRGLPTPIRVGRYHSWAIDPHQPAFAYEIIAWDDEGIPMAIRHHWQKVMAMQFHPESYMTSQGVEMLQRFLTWSEVSAGTRRE